MKAPKKTTTKVRTVVAQNIPKSYVPLSVFGKKAHSRLSKLVKSGKIPAVKLNIGRGVFYINRDEGSEAIREQKQIGSPKHEATFEPGDSFTIIKTLRELSSVNNHIVEHLLKQSKIEELSIEISDKRFEHFNNKLDNLCRHICIQGTLLYGVIEELGVQNKVLNKKVVKERIKHLNRLITQEDWDVGFELSET